MLKNPSAWTTLFLMTKLYQRTRRRATRARWGYPLA
jgi:hypothetical protein